MLDIPTVGASLTSVIPTKDCPSYAVGIPYSAAVAATVAGLEMMVTESDVGGAAANAGTVIPRSGNASNTLARRHEIHRDFVFIRVQSFIILKGSIYSRVPLLSVNSLLKINVQYTNVISCFTGKFYLKIWSKSLTA